MSLDILNEAFSKLNRLNEDVFNVTDDGIDDFAKFIEDDDSVETVDIIDAEADTEDELQDSYIGQAILQCKVCHSLIFKETEEITVDEESMTAECDCECPYCGESGGFLVIGKVASFFDDAEEEKDEEEPADDAIEAELDAIEDEVADEVPAEEIDEGLSRDLAQELSPKDVGNAKWPEEKDDGLSIVRLIKRVNKGVKKLGEPAKLIAVAKDANQVGEILKNGEAVLGRERDEMTVDGAIWPGDDEDSIRIRKSAPKDIGNAIWPKANGVIEDVAFSGITVLPLSGRGVRPGMKDSSRSIIYVARPDQIDVSGSSLDGFYIIRDVVPGKLTDESLKKTTNESFQDGGAEEISGNVNADALADFLKEQVQTLKAHPLQKSATYRIDDTHCVTAYWCDCKDCENGDEEPIYNADKTGCLCVGIKDYDESVIDGAQLLNSVDQNGNEIASIYVVEDEDYNMLANTLIDDYKTAGGIVDGDVVANSDAAFADDANADELEMECVGKGCVNEDLQNASIETDTEKVTLTQTEDGKVTLTSEPKDSGASLGDDFGDMTADLGGSEDGEFIGAMDDAEKDEIIDKSDVEDEEATPFESDNPEMDTAFDEIAGELGGEEENAEEGEEDEEDEEDEVDIQDFQEESFNRLASEYLKNIYENVSDFNTTSVTDAGDKLVVEGCIKFKSGNSKTTKFAFEAKDLTKSGKMRFVGENAQLSKGKKAFSLNGKFANSTFIAESLTYNYTATDANGKSQKISGTVSNKK